MSAYNNNTAQLEDHGNRFVCILSFRARGITDRPLDSDRVYGHLDMHGFSDQEQARAELVQYLVRQGRIHYDRSNNTVSLTDSGLDWANSHCEEPVYGIYRHLRN